MNASDATVFVVDDDMAVRRSLARLLRSAGLNVETFPSAREFLDRLPSAPAGCIVLDVRMPGMTGPELFDQMAGKGLSLPVVFLTGHGEITVPASRASDPPGFGEPDRFSFDMAGELRRARISLPRDRHSSRPVSA